MSLDVSNINGFYTATYLIRDRRSTRAPTDIAVDRRADQSATAGKYVEITRDFFLPDEATVRAEIIESGGHPLSIRRREYKWWQREWIDNQYKLRFLRAIGFHVSAGLSSGKALYVVIEGEEHSGKRLELEPALEVIRRGGTFSDAVRQMRMFDRTIVSLLTAGERTGKLDQAIKSAVAHIETSRGHWKVLTGALGWMAFDLFMAISSVIAVQYQFLPWLEKSGIDSQDPAAIQKFKESIDLAYILNGSLLWFAVVAILAVVGFTVAYFTSKGQLKEKVENLIIHIPMIKSFIYDGSLSDTFGIVGRMTEGHVSFSDASKIASDATSIPAIKNFWNNACKRLQYGDPIGRAMSSTLLSRSEILEINAHQNASQLSSVFLSIADERRDNAKRGTRKIVVLSVVGSMLYAVASALVALWALWVQNQGLMETFSSISAGG